METLNVQGRTIGAEELEWIRGLISSQPGWGRYRLSCHIAEQWNWRNGAGQLKDMAARTLLIKLERRGLLLLPPRKRGGGSRKSLPPLNQPDLFAEEIVDCPLSELLPLRLCRVDDAVERRLLTSLLSGHHYLGYRRPVGENMQYLARDRQGRVVACLVFGAAAWKCAPRDQFIGWTALMRQAHLHQVVNNMRFLIPPWVRVKHLASHVLGAVARRIDGDWQLKYGHRVYLLETFVQRDRFSGACYRAANWSLAGQTQGRSRNDAQRTLQVPCKDVYLYPLHPRFHSLLREEPA
jgi:hypothetical protein